jgi:hypothetical protein
MNGSPAEGQPSDNTQTEAIVVAPTNVEDLERRLKALREYNVRAYKDGSIEIMFASAGAARREDPQEAAFRRLAEMDAAARGGE